MNEVIQTIKRRRSVRIFKEEDIPEPLIREIIEAGVFAPNGKNNKGWHITAIKNRNMIKELEKNVKTAIASSPNEKIRRLAEKQGSSVFHNAPVVILVAYLSNISVPTQQYDTAASMQNIMLAACSLGIGSCWIHAPAVVADSPEMKSFFAGLGIPETHRVFGSIAIGRDGVNKREIPERNNDYFRIVS